MYEDEKLESVRRNNFFDEIMKHSYLTSSLMFAFPKVLTRFTLSLLTNSSAIGVEDTSCDV